MIEKGIKKYYKQQRLTIEKYSDKVKNQFDEEAIHKTRVAVKKIKALFQMTDTITSKAFHSKKEFAFIKSLFKAAGALRDIQVQLALLVYYERKENILYPELRQYFKSKIADARAPLSKAMNGFETKELYAKEVTLKTVLGKFPEEEIIARMNGLATEKLRSVEMLYKSDEDKDIHQARSLIKQCLYIYTVYNKYAINSKYAPVSLKKLDCLSEMLGKWHDKVVMINLIDEYFASDDARLINYKKYLDLQELIAQENKYCLNKIKNRISE
ncbi:CHAD domain-containing protein [Limibacter armeniacum]|uniref:CHAD domain-containing protein n=1 Tax=Limibacter armeniacum TaxID=466084 RepID=UPI002FE59261